MFFLIRRIQLVTFLFYKYSRKLQPFLLSISFALERSLLHFSCCNDHTRFEGLRLGLRIYDHVCLQLNGDVDNPNKTSASKYLVILAFNRPHPEFTLTSGLVN